LTITGRSSDPHTTQGDEALLMEAVRASETSVNFNVTTRYYIPEDSKLHTRRRDNLKSHMNSAKVANSQRMREAVSVTMLHLPQMTVIEDPVLKAPFDEFRHFFCIFLWSMLVHTNRGIKQSQPTEP
jgi:hypothetical protein